MAVYKPRVISLTKKPSQTFGFFLRMEHGEEGHLIRSLEMGGPAELAGIKDGDRIIRVNGTFVDGLSHSEVVELVKNGGTSVTFHIMDESTYKEAKAKEVNLSEQQSTLGSKVIANGVAKGDPKPKLCYLVKSASGFEFSLFSSNDEEGLFITEVSPGGVAHKAGARAKDRLLEVNGENVENCTHEQVVNKIKQAGNTIVFLLLDEDADKVCRSQYAKMGLRLATVKYLPLKPRLVNLTKGPNGYGFMLKEEPKQAGHFIKDIDGPAGRSGLKEMDRLVAVDGKEVDGCSHEQVVDMFRQSGGECCLLVVDKETDQMYKLGKVSPMLFLEELKESNLPPSYTEVMNTATPAQPDEEEEENLKPKLCRMEKTSDGFGFHLNGIQGMFGQFIKEVVKGGAADRAGLEDDDMVVEVNGVNVEQSSHQEVVEMIRRSGNSLEMLVARKRVYEQLKAKGVIITHMLLGEEPKTQKPTGRSPETSKKEIKRPTEPERQRTPSVSSSSSAESIDERL